MMDFMREGGFGMWVTVLFFAVGVGQALARRRTDGAAWAQGAALAVIASGLLGMSTGLYNTVAHAAADPEVLGIGIRESVNNTVLAAALSFVLAVLGLALPRLGGGLAPEPKA